MRNSQPVPFCLTAKVIPDCGSFTIGVSVHWEAEYAEWTFTGIVAWYAVIVVVAACAVPMERIEANTKSARSVQAERMLSFGFVCNLALFGGAL